jgi:hypothetical protein
MVEQIMDRWRGPEFEFFKVLADDGKGYLLKYDRAVYGQWKGFITPEKNIFNMPMKL